jgi:Fe-coproporphyrin III synthase
VNAITSAIRDLSGALKRDYKSRRVRGVNSLVYFTYRCTSRCKTCNIWKRNAENQAGSELPLEKWNAILENLRGYGIKSMEIFGGDALLRKDLIYDVIRFCSRNGIATYFPTNSLLLDDDTAKNLVEAGLDTIYFSLDDAGDGNDLIRGQSGTAALVRNAIQSVGRARKNGKPNIVVCTTISNMNYDRLPDLVRFLNGLPVNSIYPRIAEEYSPDNVDNSAVDGIRPEPYFTSSDSRSHLLSPSEVRAFRKIIRDLKKNADNSIYLNYRGVDEAPDTAFTEGVHLDRKCHVCTTLVTVDPRGNVVPCPMYNKYILGNLLEDSLENIWGNEKHLKFIRKQRKGEIALCKNCWVLKNNYPSFSSTFANYFRRTVEKMTRRD